MALKRKALCIVHVPSILSRLAQTTWPYMCTIVEFYRMEFYRTLSGHNVIAHMTCKVILSYNSQALYKASVQFWMKRYPSALLKTVPTYYLASEPAQIDSPLTYFKVSLLL